MLIEGLNRKDTIIIIILYLPNFHPWPGARPGRGRGGRGAVAGFKAGLASLSTITFSHFDILGWGYVINGASLSQVDWDNISQHLPL